MPAGRHRSHRSRGAPLTILTILALMLSALGTSAAAQPSDPHFIVEAYNDFVHVYGWTGPSTISISIDDPSTGAGVDYTKTETGPADTGFNINFWDEYDVQTGHVVTVTDGTTTLTHTVRDVAITELDPEADRVAGTADPESTIDLNIGGPEPIPVPLTTTVTADTLGNWEAELSPYDLLDGAWTSANRIDANGNATSFTLNPTVTVFVIEDNFHTWGWLPGIEITLIIDDPATGPDPDFTSTATSPTQGKGFFFEAGDAFDVQRGHVVTVTDGTSTVIHVARDLYVVSANVATGEVVGTADPGAALQVEAQTESGPVYQEVVADSSGNWVAGPFNLLPGAWGHVQQFDVFGNSTNVLWFPTLEFGGHRYEVFEDFVSWHDAVAFCEDIDAHLVTIGSAEENEFVFGLNSFTWLGATDELVEGNWRWVTDEPFSYTNWAPGEPNNTDGFPPHGPEHYLTYAFPQDGRWNDVPVHSTLPFICESEELQADLDIKPGSDTNPVNLKSTGLIPVAILTTEDFDATTVAPISAAFGPAGANEAHGRGHFSDVDGDGDVDFMLHFRTQETGIQPGDTEACLTAQTFEGQAIVGCDVITTG